MKIRRILCIVLSIAAACSLMLMRDSVAWVEMRDSTPVTGSLVFEELDFDIIGKLQSYYFKADTGDDKYIITDQNLITDNEGKISIVNHSTIATDVRFRVVYSKPGVSANDGMVNYTADASDYLTVTPASGWGTVVNNESTSNPDSNGYFYRSFAAGSKNNTTPVDMITNISYSELATDEASRNAYLPTSNGEVDAFDGTVRVEIQAKQQNYVDWTTIGDIQIS